MSWWNKNKKQQKEQKQRQQAQMQMLQRIATLTRFAKAGLLFIDIPQKKVFIHPIVVVPHGSYQVDELLEQPSDVVRL